MKYFFHLLTFLIRISAGPHRKFLIIILSLLSFLISCQSTTNNEVQASDTNSSNTLPASLNKDMNNHRSTAVEQRPCDLKQGSAVVLMYHKFGEPYKSTSVTVEQFMQQMAFLKNNGYTVVPLDKVVSAVKGHIPFGKKWIAITIDDAYKSFLKAKPILETHQYPYTVFVNTEAVDKQYTSSMNWEDLSNIAQSDLGELAAHSHTHGHLVQDMDTTQRVRDILLSVERIYQNTSTMPKFFSYPFGEVSDNLIKEIQNIDQVLAKSFHFSAAFSTQSGPVGCSSNIFALPRFAINEKYGVINELFKIKLTSLHLPVIDYHPKNKAICVEEGVNRVYFSIPSDIDLKDMRCYVSRGNSASVDISADGLVTILLSKPLGFGLSNPNNNRERLNCTAYYNGRYFWYGREFTILKNSNECNGKT